MSDSAVACRFASLPIRLASLLVCGARSRKEHSREHSQHSREHSEHSNAPNIPLNVLYVIESRTPTTQQAETEATRHDTRQQNRTWKKEPAVPLSCSPRKPRGVQRLKDGGRGQTARDRAEASVASQKHRPEAHTSSRRRGVEEKPRRSEPRRRPEPASRREARGAAEVKGARRG